MKYWYLIAYDVRNKKRLSRCHYYLSRRAIAMQRSVYLICVSDRKKRLLLEELKKRVHLNEDDVRIYPVRHPNDIWMAGSQNMSLDGYFFEKTEKSLSIANSIKRLFGRGSA